MQDCLDRGSVETARAILQHAISVFPGKKSLYRALAHLERQHGTPEAVAEVLERGVKYCPQVWLFLSHSWPPFWAHHDLCHCCCPLRSTASAQCGRESLTGAT